MLEPFLSKIASYHIQAYIFLFRTQRSSFWNKTEWRVLWQKWHLPYPHTCATMTRLWFVYNYNVQLVTHLFLLLLIWVKLLLEENYHSCFDETTLIGSIYWALHLNVTYEWALEVARLSLLYTDRIRLQPWLNIIKYPKPNMLPRVREEPWFGIWFIY